MSKTAIQTGGALDFLAAADHVGGAWLLVNDLLGKVALDVLTGETGVLIVEGVHDVPKAAVTVAPGEYAYWTGTTFTNVASTNKLVGHFVTDAASGVGTGRVLLKPQ